MWKAQAVADRQSAMLVIGSDQVAVLDDEIISAPRINEPITQGSGQISGNFSVETANDLAVLLRAGALPAKLSVAEERTVGPGLGADSIAAGERAAFMMVVSQPFAAVTT